MCPLSRFSRVAGPHPSQPLHAQRMSRAVATCFALALGLADMSPAAAQENAAVPAGTSAADLGLQDLQSDLSRQQLFNEIRRADEATANSGRVNTATQTFSLAGPFRFESDVDVETEVAVRGVIRETITRKRAPSVFGVDISHHNGSKFPFKQLKNRKIDFIYMKASQGAGFLDPRFASNWQRAGELPAGSRVHRGAYHFLSSGDPRIAPEDWGLQQAQTFLKVIKANGGLRDTDMPPVVDLEWDKASESAPDRWAGRTSADIVKVLLAFTTTVETELGRKPMIYTAQSWWHERMGKEADGTSLAAYPLWVADYSRSSRATEEPRSIAGATWVLWQFTDAAKMVIGFDGKFDANIYKGDAATFRRSLGVKEF